MGKTGKPLRKAADLENCLSEKEEAKIGHWQSLWGLAGRTGDQDRHW